MRFLFYFRLDLFRFAFSCRFVLSPTAEMASTGPPGGPPVDVPPPPPPPPIKEEKHEARIESMSLFCDDVECKARYLTSLPSGDGYHGNRLFVCQCLSSLDGDEPMDEILMEAEGCIDTRMGIGPDTVNNVREIACAGMKCRTSYGCNLNIHCSDCHGSVLTYVRMP